MAVVDVEEGAAAAPVVAVLGLICEDPICERLAASRGSVLLGDSSPTVVNASTSFTGVFLRSGPRPRDWSSGGIGLSAAEIMIAVSLF